jgi:hypothetical protein
MLAVLLATVLLESLVLLPAVLLGLVAYARAATVVPLPSWAVAAVGALLLVGGPGGCRGKSQWCVKLCFTGSAVVTSASRPCYDEAMQAHWQTGMTLRQASAMQMTTPTGTGPSYAAVLVRRWDIHAAGGTYMPQVGHTCRRWDIHAAGGTYMPQGPSQPASLAPPWLL